jgi:hypothetical protein
MQRVHLFELEDYDWVPRPIRDGGTDLLDLGFERIGFYDGVIPELSGLLARTNEKALIDLCSGGGGGTLALYNRLGAARADVTLSLSDRHPNEAGQARVAALGNPAVRYRSESVDAMQGGGDVKGLRTMSGALHHFRPEQVRALIGGVVAHRAPLAFFDVAASPQIRKLPVVLAPLAMLVNMIALSLGSLFLVPLVRPFRFSRVVLTYLVPLIPLLVAWDGTVSALRAYSPEEVLSYARSVPGGDGYTWEAGVRGSALFLFGTPNA